VMAGADGAREDDETRKGETDGFHGCDSRDLRACGHRYEMMFLLQGNDICL
jgi:hypothetical protein